MQNGLVKANFQGSPDSIKIDTDFQIMDYSNLLIKKGLNYKPSEYYWQVGEISRTQGWILHLSVVPSQSIKLFELVIPILASRNVAFKIVRDTLTAERLINGNFGYRNVGKIVSIYPANDAEAANLAQLLIDHTRHFGGPEIPTDILLGGIVYTRYGSFNPVYLKTSKGQELKHIYNVKGELVPDVYDIPFSFPVGINWPFQRIIDPVPQKRQKLLNNSYYPIFTLKKDNKGKVIKAIYFTKLFQIKTCVIKEGCKYIFWDDAGRDMRDRIKWQYTLHLELSNVTSLPKAIELFEENGKTYLAVQYIKGAPLSKVLSGIYNGGSWMVLENHSKLKILNILAQILNIIQTFHSRKFIHRDITLENFLIDKYEKVYAIDVELTWSSLRKTPTPPFQLGTPGYMSPQQENSEMPIVEDDIYALGALIMGMLTNLHPSKFPLRNWSKLKTSIQFFVQDLEITNLINRCLEVEPDKRPHLSIIQNWVTQFTDKLNSQIHNGNANLSHHVYPERVDHKELGEVIQAGIKGLSNPTLLSPRHRWLSPKKQSDDHIDNSQLEVAVYQGWHTGMAGPLWLVARAKRAGFDIQDCQTAYDSSWDYLDNNFFKEPESYDPGLFHGGAGVALALVEGWSGGLLKKDDMLRTRLNKCFIKETLDLTVSEGTSGQGLALLASAKCLENDMAESLLTSYIHCILSNQRRDGSWQRLHGSSRKFENNSLNISNGISGIIAFLLAYLREHNENEVVNNATVLALNWLIKKTNLKSGNNMGLGAIDISSILVFIKAYEVLKMPVYKEIAETNLLCLPSTPIMWDFALAGGLAGLGELYLEAYKVFKNPEWLQRASWIVGVFIHCFNYRNDHEGYWLMNKNDTITADLFAGNAGILHYLIRFLNITNLTHPLWPMGQ